MISIFRNNQYSNTYILERFNVCYIVDPSFDLEEILEKVGEKEILGVLLTHAHYDHTMLINKFKSPIYVHKDDAALLFEDEYNGFSMSGTKRPYSRKELDLRLLNGGEELKIGDQVVCVFHTPGHTKGSLSFLHQDKLISGDTLFKGSIGRTDFYSGNIYEMKKSILFLINNSIDSVKVYPGHGEYTTIKNERKCNMYYLKWEKQAKK